MWTKLPRMVVNPYGCQPQILWPSQRRYRSPTHSNGGLASIGILDGYVGLWGLAVICLAKIEMGCMLFWCHQFCSSLGRDYCNPLGHHPWSVGIPEQLVDDSFVCYHEFWALAIWMILQVCCEMFHPSTRSLCTWYQNWCWLGLLAQLLTIGQPCSLHSNLCAIVLCSNPSPWEADMALFFPMLLARSLSLCVCLKCAAISIPTLHHLTTWNIAGMCVCCSWCWLKTLAVNTSAPATGNAGSHLHPQGQDGVICNAWKPAVFNVLCVRTLCGVPLQPGMFSWQTWSCRTLLLSCWLLAKFSTAILGSWLLGFCASCPSLSPSNNHIWHDVCICFAMLQHAYQGASLWERWPKGWNHQRRGCNISTPNHAVNLNLHCIAAIGSFCAAAGQFGVVFARAMVPPKWH